MGPTKAINIERGQRDVKWDDQWNGNLTKLQWEASREL